MKPLAASGNRRRTLAFRLVAIPAAAALILTALFGHETRGRDLRELDAGSALKGVSV